MSAVSFIILDLYAGLVADTACKPQENVKTKHPQLLYESKLYRILQGGSKGKFNFIAYYNCGYCDPLSFFFVSSSVMCFYILSCLR